MTRDASDPTDAPSDPTTTDTAGGPSGSADRGETTPASPVTVSDPAVVCDREDVDSEIRDPRAVDRDEFREHERWAGVAVVGVTDDDGRVALLWKDDDHAQLPHAPVEPGDDFAAAARRTAAEQFDLEVAVADVVRVRRERYRLADDGRVADEAETTTVHHVLFHASLAGADPEDTTPVTDRGCWTAAWSDRVPPNPDWDRPDVREDVRRILE